MFELKPVAVKTVEYEMNGRKGVSYKATFVKNDGDTFALKTPIAVRAGDICVIDLVSQTVYTADGKAQVITAAKVVNVRPALAGK